jgi:hypothetical protein
MTSPFLETLDQYLCGEGKDHQKGEASRVSILARTNARRELRGIPHLLPPVRARRSGDRTGQLTSHRARFPNIRSLNLIFD